MVAFCGINFGTLNFTLPFFGNINLILPQLLNYIITSFWIVGITNSINWLDGIDALAAGYSSILTIGLCLLMILQGNMIGVIFFSILFGSIFGFLLRNFKPAFYIMGDCGSNLLGFSLSTSSLFFLNYSNSKSIPIYYLVLIFSLPVFDMCYVIANRLLNHKNIFKADRSHIHHRLLDLNFKYKELIFILYLYSFLSISFGISKLN